MYIHISIIQNAPCSLPGSWLLLYDNWRCLHWLARWIHHHPVCLHLLAGLVDKPLLGLDGQLLVGNKLVLLVGAPLDRVGQCHAQVDAGHDHHQGDRLERVEGEHGSTCLSPLWVSWKLVCGSICLERVFIFPFLLLSYFWVQALDSFCKQDFFYFYDF